MSHFSLSESNTAWKVSIFDVFSSPDSVQMQENMDQKNFEMDSFYDV